MVTSELEFLVDWELRAELQEGSPATGVFLPGFAVPGVPLSLRTLKYVSFKKERHRDPLQEI